MKKEELIKEKFVALKKYFDNAAGNGDEVTEAVKDLYTLYDEKLISWLAGLYDHKIGGFYYDQRQKIGPHRPGRYRSGGQ